MAEAAGGCWLAPGAVISEYGREIGAEGVGLYCLLLSLAGEED